MRVYLGLDNGGTTTKAALFDRYGRQLAVSSASTRSIHLKPGYVERDMDEMWDANCNVIRDVLAKCGVSGSDVAGVAICGHGKGLYLWGKDDRPVRNGIISTDNRAYEYPIKWKTDGTEDKVFNISCQHILACQPVCLLAWLKDNEPELYSNIKWVFEAKDYVRFRMTGIPCAEYTDYSGANLLNLHTKNYDINLLELFGIKEVFPALPPLCSATEICGHITDEAAEKCGLAAGTPVIGGMFDIDACALAVGITDERNICMIAGTWSINEYICNAPVLDGSVAMNSLFTLPNYCLVEESSPTSAGNNEWFLKQLLPEFIDAKLMNKENYYDELNQWVEEIKPEEFVPVFLPFLMASNVNPMAKSCFIGLSANHTRKHMLRSVYEGIAFCHRMHVERLMNSRKTTPDCIRLAGGAANSRVWTQMFADILQLPIETVNVSETGALGCAITVAVAIGDYPDIETAIKNMCDISPAVHPDKTKAEIYNRKYNLYKKAIACLDPLWESMQALIEEGQ